MNLFSDKVNTDYFNVATGNGYSNMEIIEKVKEITGVDFLVEYGERRAGDPDELVADNSKIKKILGWEPINSGLDTIINTAWKWHNTHPNGFGKNK